MLVQYVILGIKLTFGEPAVVVLEKVSQRIRLLDPYPHGSLPAVKKRTLSVSLVGHDPHGNDQGIRKLVF